MNGEALQLLWMLCCTQNTASESGAIPENCCQGYQETENTLVKKDGATATRLPRACGEGSKGKRKPLVVLPPQAEHPLQYLLPVFVWESDQVAGSVSSNCLGSTSRVTAKRRQHTA